MSSRLARIIVASSLGALAAGYGLVAYVSFGIREALTAVAGWVLNRPGIPTVYTWDEWFFVALCTIAALGTIGMFFRRKWARIVSFLAFGASGLWALVIGLAPESWRGVWFYTWVERWVAALVILLSIGGLGWLCSQKAKDELETLREMHGH